MNPTWACFFTLGVLIVSSARADAPPAGSGAKPPPTEQASESTPALAAQISIAQTEVDRAKQEVEVLNANQVHIRLLIADQTDVCNLSAATAKTKGIDKKSKDAACATTQALADVLLKTTTKIKDADKALNDATTKLKKLKTKSTEMATADESTANKMCLTAPAVGYAAVLESIRECATSPTSTAKCVEGIQRCDVYGRAGGKLLKAAPPAQPTSGGTAANTVAKVPETTTTEKLLAVLRDVVPQSLSCKEFASRWSDSLDVTLLEACRAARASLRERILDDCIKGISDRCKALGTKDDPKCLTSQRATCEKSRDKTRGSGDWSLLVGSQASGTSSGDGETASAGLALGVRYASTHWDVILAARLNPTELDPIVTELDAGRFLLRPARDSTAAATAILRSFPFELPHGLAIGFEHELSVGSRQWKLAEEDVNAVAIRHAYRIALKYTNWRYSNDDDDPVPTIATPEKKVTVVLRTGMSAHHLLSDVLDGSRQWDRIDLLGTNTTDWMGFDFGLSVEYGELSVSFEVPLVWAASR